MEYFTEVMRVWKNGLKRGKCGRKLRFCGRYFIKQQIEEGYNEFVSGTINTFITGRREDRI